MVFVGWVEVRNPTATMVVLGFARLYPTYGNTSLTKDGLCRLAEGS